MRGNLQRHFTPFWLLSTGPTAKLPRPRFSITSHAENVLKGAQLADRSRVQAPPNPADNIKTLFRRVSLEGDQEPWGTVEMLALHASSAAVFSVSPLLADTTQPEIIDSGAKNKYQQLGRPVVLGNLREIYHRVSPINLQPRLRSRITSGESQPIAPRPPPSRHHGVPGRTADPVLETAHPEL